MPTITPVTSVTPEMATITPETSSPPASATSIVPNVRAGERVISTPEITPVAGETAIRTPQGFMERWGARRRHGADPVLGFAAETIRSGLRAVPGRLGEEFAEPLAAVLPQTPTDIVTTLATLPFGAGGALVKGALQRSGASALAAAAMEGAEGRNPVTGALRYGAAQLGGEALATPFRLAAGSRALRRTTGPAQTAYEQAVKNREATIARDRAMHRALTALEKDADERALEAAQLAHRLLVADVTLRNEQQAAASKLGHETLARDIAARNVAAKQAATAAHAQTERQWAERGAEHVAAWWKQAVPAWRHYASDTKGLLEMVFGTGQADLSKAFDASLKAVVTEGRGTNILLPESDLRVLGIKLRKKKVVDRGRLDGQLEVQVDAGLAAERIVGQGAKHPEMYSRIVHELDRLNIGDPAARAEYKTGQALIGFAKKTKMLAGDVFHPDRAHAGLTDVSTVNELRRRGAGDVFRGPIADVARGGPGPLSLPAPEVVPPYVAPAKIQKPVFTPPAKSPARVEPAAPPEPAKPAEVPPGFRVRTLPIIKHPYVAGGALELPFAAAGHHLYGGPFVAGSILSSLASGRRLVTKAPLDPRTELLLRAFPTEAAQWSRRVLESEPAPEPTR